jgi:hypothetical protein
MGLFQAEPLQVCHRLWTTLARTNADSGYLMVCFLLEPLLTRRMADNSDGIDIYRSVKLPKKLENFGGVRRRMIKFEEKFALLCAFSC